jgi:hypothetical protein
MLRFKQKFNKKILFLTAVLTLLIIITVVFSFQKQIISIAIEISCKKNGFFNVICIVDELTFREIHINTLELENDLVIVKINNITLSWSSTIQKLEDLLIDKLEIRVKDSPSTDKDKKRQESDSYINILKNNFVEKFPVKKTLIKNYNISFSNYALDGNIDIIKSKDVVLAEIFVNGEEFTAQSHFEFTRDYIIGRNEIRIGSKFVSKHTEISQLLTDYKLDVTQSDIDLKIDIKIYPKTLLYKSALTMGASKLELDHNDIGLSLKNTNLEVIAEGKIANLLGSMNGKLKVESAIILNEMNLDEKIQLEVLFNNNEIIYNVFGNNIELSKPTRVSFSKNQKISSTLITGSTITIQKLYLPINGGWNLKEITLSHTDVEFNFNDNLFQIKDSKIMGNLNIVSASNDEHQINIKDIQIPYAFEFIESDHKLHINQLLIKSLTRGEIRAQDLDAKIIIDTKPSLSINRFRTDIFGGILSVSPLIYKPDKPVEVEISLQNIDLKKLKQSIPEISGEISGRANGYIRFSYEDNNFLPGNSSIFLIESDQEARLNYPADGLLTQGLEKGSMQFQEMKKAESALKDLELNKLNFTINPESSSPIILSIGGSNTQTTKGFLPGTTSEKQTNVNLDLRLNGSLESLINLGTNKNLNFSLN